MIGIAGYMIFEPTTKHLQQGLHPINLPIELIAFTVACSISRPLPFRVDACPVVARAPAA